MEEKISLEDMILVVDERNNEKIAYVMAFEDYLEKIKSLSGTTAEEAAAIEDLYSTKTKPYYQSTLMNLSNHTIKAGFCRDEYTLDIFVRGGKYYSPTGDYGRGNWKIRLDKCSPACGKLLQHRYPKLFAEKLDLRKIVLVIENNGPCQTGSVKSLGSVATRFVARSDTTEEITDAMLNLLDTKDEPDLKGIFDNDGRGGIRMALCPDENTLKYFINGGYRSAGKEWKFDPEGCSPEYGHLCQLL